MNQRERILGVAVAALLAMVVGFFAWSSWEGAVTRRQGALTNLRKTISEQDRTLRQASRASRALVALQQRSLPANREQASSVYQRWMLDLVDRVGFVEPAVNIADRRVRAGSFEQLRFTIDTQGTLPQLTDFLTEFYKVSDLHRIQSLSVKPIKDSRQLDLLITVDAISLPGATRTQVGDTPGTRLQELDPAQIRDTILARSVFFPANLPPTLATVSDQKIVRDTTMTLRASASDPDPWDQLNFRLEGEIPEGMEIVRQEDGEAEIRWKPVAVGEYDVQLLVEDSARPPATSVRPIHISVVDPPPVVVAAEPPRAGFDDASQTFLVGTVANGAQRQAWFSVRTKGELLKLDVGAPLKVGSMEGNLVAITDTHVEISSASGTTRVRIGQALTEGTLLAAPEQPATTESSSSS